LVFSLHNLIKVRQGKDVTVPGNTWEAKMVRTNKVPCSHLDTEIRRSEWRRSCCSHTWYLFHRKLRDPWGQSDREKSLKYPLAFNFLTEMHWTLTAVVRKVMFFLEHLLTPWNLTTLLVVVPHCYPLNIAFNIFIQQI